MHLDLKEEVKVKATRSLPSVQYFKSVKASLIVSFQSLRTDQFDIFSSCVRNDLKATLKCLLCGSAENNKRHAAADKVFVNSQQFCQILRETEFTKAQFSMRTMPFLEGGWIVNACFSLC